jgi:hypothetical protein
MAPSVTSPTLQQVINDRMRSKGLSRHQLIQQIGNTNVSKGLRKLDTFLGTLAAPGDEFVSRLLDILGIDVPTYLRAYESSCDALAVQAKDSFSPYIVLNIDFLPQPWFAAQIIHARCTVPVPTDIIRLPFQKEIASVIALYNDRASKLSFGERIKGFRYYRNHDCCLVFDQEFACNEISSSYTFPQCQCRLGNRLLDTLINPHNGGTSNDISEYSS